jgi:saccharopine dehydrogenase-like NADP-dependent oxidoreductase
MGEILKSNGKIILLGGGGVVGTSLAAILDTWGNETIVNDLPSVGIPKDSPGKEHLAEVRKSTLPGILDDMKAVAGDIVVDLVPTLDKMETLKQCEERGISCVNTTTVAGGDTTSSFADLLMDPWKARLKAMKAPHILNAGMNPGCVNVMAAAVEPAKGSRCTVYEYDGSTGPEVPFATWSRHEFWTEFTDEATWEAYIGKQGRLCIEYRDGPPVKNIVLFNAPAIGSFKGAICEHEELLSITRRWDCRTLYVYGFEPANLKAYVKAAAADEKKIPSARKPNLHGTDTVGVKVESGLKNTWIWASMDNDDPRVPDGSTATAYLVAAGIACAVKALQAGEVLNGAVFPEDLDARKWLKCLEGLCTIGVKQ